MATPAKGRAAGAAGSAVPADVGTATAEEYEFAFDLGATWVNLLSTVRSWRLPGQMELLDSVDRLEEWLAEIGATPSKHPDVADLERVREVRGALRVLAESAIAGKGYRKAADKKAVAELDDLLIGRRSGERPVIEQVVIERVVVERPVIEKGALALRRPDDVTAVLVSVARQAILQLTGPEAAQLHYCAADDCTRIFLDPGGRRRWCSTRLCGNRQRVREFRERHRN